MMRRKHDPEKAARAEPGTLDPAHARWALAVAYACGRFDGLGVDTPEGAAEQFAEGYLTIDWALWNPGGLRELTERDALLGRPDLLLRPRLLARLIELEGGR